jgi:asparagine synthetase A
MVEAKLLRKKLKNGLIVDKWDLVTIIEKQEAQIAELETGLKNVWKVVEGKQTEIDRLNYDMEGFKQNFFVSGFHLQIKMANEQLLKQQEQIDFLKEQLEDCTCQGGHSQAYLKAKGKAQEK